jgi:hypothetical protein
VRIRPSEKKKCDRETELGCGGLIAFGLGTSAGKNTDPFINDAKIDDDIFCRIANDAKRIETLLDALDLFFEQSPQDNDPFVARGQMFLCSIGHLALSFPRHRILR